MGLTSEDDCTLLYVTVEKLTNMLFSNIFRIMVLAAGQIVEFESPSILLQDKAGVFYGLAKDANLVS